MSLSSTNVNLNLPLKGKVRRSSHRIHHLWTVSLQTFVPVNPADVKTFHWITNTYICLDSSPGNADISETTFSVVIEICHKKGTNDSLIVPLWFFYVFKRFKCLEHHLISCSKFTRDPECICVWCMHYYLSQICLNKESTKLFQKETEKSVC